jgi:hypothetical protein
MITITHYATIRITIIIMTVIIKVTFCMTMKSGDRRCCVYEMQCFIVTYLDNYLNLVELCGLQGWILRRNCEMLKNKVRVN